MANRVKVTSVDAIDSFRASLVVYLAKARATLDDVHAEVTRTRVWVQYHQRTHWEETFKRCARQLEEAQAALFSSKMSTVRKVTAAEQMAVAKAKRAKEDAEIKLRVIRKWDRDYDNNVDPLMRHLEKTGSILADDMAKAVHYLTQTLAALQEYTSMAAPGIGEPATSAKTQKPIEDSANAKSSEATAISKGAK